MAASTLRLLEMRMETLEAEVAHIKGQVNAAADSDLPWWEKRGGMFDNDPDYDARAEPELFYWEATRPPGLIFLPVIFLLAESLSRKMAGRKILKLRPCAVYQRRIAAAAVPFVESSQG